MSKKSLAQVLRPNEERDYLLDILGEISKSLVKLRSELANIETIIAKVRSKYQ